jgi:predicted nucleic acid-binding protein
MELYAAPHISTVQEQKIEALLAALAGVVSVDREVAGIAGRLLARYRRDRGLNVADALVAASAIYMEAPLVTRNTRHFDFIEGLVVSRPY